MRPSLPLPLAKICLIFCFAILAVSSGVGQTALGFTQAPIKIDLTKVCSMIDSSSGTGTCSGTNLNASSAFGGATSGTVSFLLAASQSNVGGSIWYGQNKTIQGLAKNTFDSINNQAATIAP